jgi:hypothetical protein
MGGHLHHPARGEPAPLPQSACLSLPGMTGTGSEPAGRTRGSAGVSADSSGSGAAASWPRRVLKGGGWRSLIRCLGSQHESQEMQQVVSIGLMYLAKEVSC